MANKTTEDFYYNLSRKELQSLCKKYGLPANRSHSELATLLISYLETKNLNLKAISSITSLCGNRETLPSTSSILHLKPGTELNTVGDAKKDSRGFILCLSEEERKRNCYQDTNFKDTSCCFGVEYNDKGCLGGSVCNLLEMSHSNIIFQCDKSGLNHKESQKETSGNAYLGFTREGTEENMPQIKGRNLDIGANTVENAIVSSSKSCPGVCSTSFEFHVMSEEGINLLVDLNSSPSDWAKRFKNEVNICEGVNRNKLWSFHQGLENPGSKEVKKSFLWNMDSGQINGHVSTTFSPSSKTVDNDPTGFEQPDKDDASLLSCTTMPCGMAIDVSEKLNKGQAFISSEPDSNTQDQANSANESCAKDPCMVILDSDATNPQLKSACNSVVNSMSDGPPSPLQSKVQGSKSGDEVFGNLTLQNSCSLVNPSMEMLTSEVASCHKDVSCTPRRNGGGFLDSVDPKHNVEAGPGLANTSEHNLDTYSNLLPTCIEESEKSNVINGRESSECSQIDNSVGRTCLSSNDMESREPHKKRKRADGEDESPYGKPDAKILRSSKHIAWKVLPRRSMRLIAKVSKFFGETLYRQT